jgi:hypothetical protein
MLRRLVTSKWRLSGFIRKTITSFDRDVGCVLISLREMPQRAVRSKIDLIESGQASRTLSRVNWPELQERRQLDNCDLLR